MLNWIPLIAEFVAGAIATAIAVWLTEVLTEWFVYVMQEVIAAWVTAILNDLVAFLIKILAPA